MSSSSLLAKTLVQGIVPAMVNLQHMLSIVKSPISFDYPKSGRVKDDDKFDFIIVGAGSAGSVIANRLTEVDKFTVLLIEAGGDPPYTSIVPGLFLLVDYSKDVWNYYSIDDGYSSQAFKSRTIHATRGKMLGGSSGANYMYYVRGNEFDFQSWANAGNPSWNWENVTYYFKKSEIINNKEILRGPSGKLHGTRGYLGVSKPEYEGTEKYLNAFKDIGYEILDDTNGYNQIGYSMPQYTILNQTRQSTAVAYLKPILQRKNFYLLKKSLVTKILIDKNRTAYGVKVLLKNGKEINLYANLEVIISAGAINSPQLLMLSGIGPRDHLESHNITVIKDLPVGQNLQDHMILPVAITGNRDDNLYPIFNNIDLLINVNKYPTATIMGHIALNRSQTYQDYQALVYPVKAGSFTPMLACAYVMRLDDAICETLVNAGENRAMLFTMLALSHPESSGEIKLKDTNPESYPLINLGYYRNKNDIDKHAFCIEDFVEVVNSSYFKSVGGSVVDLNVPQCKGYKFGTHEYWKCYVLNVASTEWHFSGTCAMGPKGVVDETLHVHGIKKLRIADASIMPFVTSGNTNAPTIMIGEKVSDMIKEEHGIPVDYVI